MKILFVGHDANRAGAQLLLLRWLQLLQQHEIPNLSFDILLRSSGPIFSSFAKLGKTHVWYCPPSVNLLGKVRRVIRPQEFVGTLEQLKGQSYDLIFSNTIANGELLPLLKETLQCPVVTYIHEVEAHIRMYTQPAHFEQVLRHTDRWVACGPTVARQLSQNHGVLPQNIQTLPSILAPEMYDYQIDNDKQTNLKKQLGIPHDAFVVGGVGTVDLRKGVDFFIQTAAQMGHLPMYFLWLGGKKNQPDFQQFAADINRMGLRNIQLHEAVANPLDYLALLDVLLLCSRDEGYPLVALEAALLGKPTLAFGEAGGAADFLTDGAGVVLPYLDLEATQIALEKLHKNPDFYQNLSQTAFQKVRQFHHPEQAFPHFLDALQS
jgi:glycosyltransferase involved in cell wall biosynthesis